MLCAPTTSINSALISFSRPCSLAHCRMDCILGASSSFNTAKISSNLPSAASSDRASPCLICPASSKVMRSEEHTSELQSHSDLVCRLLLEKKKKNKTQSTININNTT